ncbi:hypothetical protein B0H34DRAFT_728251 [Crassisporium funariophilum]|nr:hypothetical protein B0H34DRAFT_734678 [Crassisporium funariophilum]KAF8150898.1 hypothetical protein B0H34DRAFT_730539 [Crassisporium funariophilum]KAF8151601.1 hypothetical protein B0H34DRAFT_728251 [Crassisporium funariophilum]
MSSSPQHSTDSSQLIGSEKSLASFVRGMAATVRKLNSSIDLLTQYLADGVINDNLRSVLESIDSQTSDLTLSDVSAPTSTPVSAKTSVAPAQESDANATNEGRWYAVAVGRNPGVFRGSQNVTPNVERIPGGFATKHETEAQAKADFDVRLAAGQVQKVELVITRTTLTPETYYG